MSISQKIENMMLRRIRIMQQIKQVYMQIQKNLVLPDETENENLESRRKSLLAEMASLEKEWKNLLLQLRAEKGIPTTQADLIISLSLSENEITRYFAFRDQLNQMLSDIIRIRKNNSLLRDKSLQFVPGRKRERTLTQKMFKKTTIPEKMLTIRLHAESDD